MVDLFINGFTFGIKRVDLFFGVLCPSVNLSVNLYQRSH